MFCVDKIKKEHLAILSNLKSCQFAPKIVIFNLCICCQFEDSQIISPKISPMSQIATFNCDKWGLIFLQYIFLFLLVHNSEFLGNLIKSVPDHILMWSSAQWVKSMDWNKHQISVFCPCAWKLLDISLCTHWITLISHLFQSMDLKINHLCEFGPASEVQ